jgi:3D-(3,5/4)-trihydroxycyclohexane-1,2-dione acylhydrolase (decyclizing)
MGGMGYIGTPAAGRAAAEADLVICVGTRLQDFVTGSNSAFENPDVQFISLNVNGRDAYKLGALPVTADAKLALDALIEAGKELGLKPNAEWVDRATAWKADWEETKRRQVYTRHPGERISQGQVIGILNDRMQPGDTLVSAAGTPPADLTKLFDASNGRIMHLEFGNSCMGYDIPAAIGVRMSEPEGEVFVLLGDGNYQMHPLELVTAMQERAKITVVLIVNDGY